MESGTQKPNFSWQYCNVAKEHNVAKTSKQKWKSWHEYLE